MVGYAEQCNLQSPWSWKILLTRRVTVLLKWTSGIMELVHMKSFSFKVKSQYDDPLKRSRNYVYQLL
jgi:hypothetical protein